MSEPQSIETTKAKSNRRTTKRRGYGEGSIYQRGDGRWCASVVVGRNERGDRIRRTVYGATKRDAQDRLIEIQSRRQAGTLPETKRLTVAEYLNHWLAVAKVKVRPNTLAGYDDAVRVHINPLIGGIQLTALSAVHVENMLIRMRNGGTPLGGVRRTFETLRTALNRACSKKGKTRKLIPFNPCDDVECPKPPKKEIDPYTLEQARKFLTESRGTRFHALFVLAIDAGMRQGELFGLKWEDIDLDRGALVIRRALGEVKGRQYWCEPKSKKSRRRLSLSPMAMDALREHRTIMMAEGHAGAETVFCNADGGLLGKSNFRRRVWLPLLKKAEVPVKRFHDLRHTNISLMLNDGEPILTASRRAGHSSIAITMDIYGHLLESEDRRAADKLGSRLDTRVDEGTGAKTA